MRAVLSVPARLYLQVRNPCHRNFAFDRKLRYAAALCWVRFPTPSAATCAKQGIAGAGVDLVWQGRAVIHDIKSCYNAMRSMGVGRTSSNVALVDTYMRGACRRRWLCSLPLREPLKRVVGAQNEITQRAMDTQAGLVHRLRADGWLRTDRCMLAMARVDRRNYIADTSDPWEAYEVRSFAVRE